MKVKTTVKVLLGLIGFVIVVSGFLWCFYNPNIWIEQKHVSGHVFVEEYQKEIPLEGFVSFRHIDFYNREGFILMGIGLATIILGLVLGDIEIFSEKEEKIEKPFFGYNR